MPVTETHPMAAIVEALNAIGAKLADEIPADDGPVSLTSHVRYVAAELAGIRAAIEDAAFDISYSIDQLTQAVRDRG